MAAGTSPIFGATVKTQVQTFAAADTTTKKTLYTAGANGSIILGVIATTSDTAANDVNLYVQSGGAGTVANIGGKRVAIASGDVVASTIPSVQLLDANQIPTLLPDKTMVLGPSDIFQAAVVATVTAAKTLTIVTFATDY